MNAALFDVPKLAAKIKQLEVLNNAMTQQLADLKQCYDLGWFLSEEDWRWTGRLTAVVQGKRPSIH
ncbi:hypothetical protein [Motiliproteus sp. MSK22-1]|uniref:hypothetical protein n=1 Tax=Motiliproteus sp. MSK22-1 TaxID=1897630 RepID=UPI0009772E6D|nr:hypothetical protein [Motiliproteus sp. MSK22-1]OMH25233.1 hypothetical protein BGP75_25850 [Motiliproteus sp. MSK22-1]